jgi:transporter family protein
MTPSAVLIGGIAPAVCLGLGTVLMRGSIAGGATIPLYLAVVGSTVALVGWAAIGWSGWPPTSVRGIGLAVAMGLSWSTAIACMAYGFGTLKLPVAVVAPLSNSNALVAVLVGALVFAEWRDLQIAKVICGTLLICAGATTVALAK